MSRFISLFEYNDCDTCIIYFLRTCFGLFKRQVAKCSSVQRILVTRLSEIGSVVHSSCSLPGTQGQTRANPRDYSTITIASLRDSPIWFLARRAWLHLGAWRGLYLALIEVLPCIQLFWSSGHIVHGCCHCSLQAQTFAVATCEIFTRQHGQ